MVTTACIFTEVSYYAIYIHYTSPRLGQYHLAIFQAMKG